MIHILWEPLEDIRAVYSACILLWLVSTFTLATTVSLLAHDLAVTPGLRQLEEVEIAWRTHDMMFFTVSAATASLSQAVAAGLRLSGSDARSSAVAHAVAVQDPGRDPQHHCANPGGRCLCLLHADNHLLAVVSTL